MRSLVLGIVCTLLGVWTLFFSQDISRDGGVTAPPKPISVEQGIASFYGARDGFHGKCMANGLIFNKEAMTAAHNSLSLGTKVRVIYHGRSVILTIMDRGPYEPGRIIDLSEGAARTLGLIGKGFDLVTIEVLERPKRSKTYHHQNPECLHEMNQKA